MMPEIWHISNINLKIEFCPYVWKKNWNRSTRIFHSGHKTISRKVWHMTRRDGSYEVHASVSRPPWSRKRRLEPRHPGLEKLILNLEDQVRVSRFQTSVSAPWESWDAGMHFIRTVSTNHIPNFPGNNFMTSMKNRPISIFVPARWPKPNFQIHVGF